MRKEGLFSATRQFGSGFRLARKLRKGWMFDVPLVALLVIALLAGEFLLYYFFPAAFSPFLHHAHQPNQGVIKRD